MQTVIHNEEQPATDPAPPAPIDDYRPPTGFEKAVLQGLQLKPRGAVYQGYAEVRVITDADGFTTLLPDPREAATARRRARNRCARKSRRINRIRSGAKR